MNDGGEVGRRVVVSVIPPARDGRQHDGGVGIGSAHRIDDRIEIARTAPGVARLGADQMSLRLGQFAVAPDAGGRRAVDAVVGKRIVCSDHQKEGIGRLGSRVDFVRPRIGGVKSQPIIQIGIAQPARVIFAPGHFIGAFGCHG